MTAVRRRDLLAGLAGLGAVGAGLTVGWGRYSGRNDINLQLYGRNETGLLVELDVEVTTTDDSFAYDTTVDLPPAVEYNSTPEDTANEPAEQRTDAQTEQITGPWMKSTQPYEITVTAGEQELSLPNESIRSRAGADSWGTVPVTLTIVFRHNGTLNAEITADDR